jgi:protein involved in polysaccharide export with SLBB domain
MLTLILGTGAFAQVSGITPEQLQQLQQQRGGTNSTVQSAVIPRETILEPTAPSAPQPESDLEKILSMRAGTKLKLYGYDQLGVGRAVSLPQVGAVQEGYVLGVGDEIVLTLRGQENTEFRVQVDRDGNVTFPRLNPVSAAGRTFGQFRQALNSAVARAFVSTQAFVTVGRLRQISVLVSGEVGSPGVRTLTGLSTVADAIFVSGGILKSGSLRNVRVVRGGRERSVDLYGLLIGRAGAANFALADGDKIVVPALGATVAVAGEVRRPGIYELAAGQSGIRVRDAVGLASGMAVAGSYVVSQLRTLPDGKRQLVDVSGGTDALLRDGEIVIVRASVNQSVNLVSLMGAVRTPGTLALGKYKTIRDLLPSTNVLEPGAYMLFGIVERTDPLTMQRTILMFSPIAVVQGKSNFPLMSDDTVHIFNKQSMRNLLDVISAAKKEVAPLSKGSVSSISRPVRDLAASGDALAMVQTSDQAAPKGLTADDLVNASANGQSASSVNGPTNAPVSGASQAGGLPDTASGPSARQAVPTELGGVGGSAGLLGLPARSASSTVVAAIAATSDLGGLSAENVGLFGKMIANYRVVVSGAVHDPGIYLVYPGTPIGDLVSTAGGLTDNVDMTSFEITSTNVDNAAGTSATERRILPVSKEVLANTTLKAFDRLIFRSIYSDINLGLVTVGGEVRYPGNLDILRGEKLSSVLRRAGGFTEIAYPVGAVFQRTSVAKAEQDESNRMVTDMRSQLLTYLLRPQSNGAQSPLNGETIAALQSLLAEISSRPAVGRVPVVADLQMLEKHPELDIALEPGDSIIVPKRPSTVLVVGEVLRAGAQRYSSSYSVDDYINSAGGTAETADTSRVIIVLPDGSVRTNGTSWLDFGFGSDIPAGSTIYVPRRLEIYQFRQMLADTIQIVSQLATTAAAMAVISKQ